MDADALASKQREFCQHSFLNQKKLPLNQGKVMLRLVADTSGVNFLYIFLTFRVLRHNSFFGTIVRSALKLLCHRRPPVGDAGCGRPLS